jgi:hypothetical protein
LDLYPSHHAVTAYEAAPYPVADPFVRTVPLRELPGVELSPLATLYVPPARPPQPDLEVAERLGLRLHG